MTDCRHLESSQDDCSSLWNKNDDVIENRQASSVEDVANSDKDFENAWLDTESLLKESKDDRNHLTPRLTAFHEKTLQPELLPRALRSASSAAIYPISTSDQSDQYDSLAAMKMTPLSPLKTSPSKRAHSLDGSLAIAINMQHEEEHPAYSRTKSSPQNSDWLARAETHLARLLDEWKHKGELKHAKDGAVVQISKGEGSSPTHVSIDKQDVFDARLDSVLQTLPADVTVPQLPVVSQFASPQTVSSVASSVLELEKQNLRCKAELQLEVQDKPTNHPQQTRHFAKLNDDMGPNCEKKLHLHAIEIENCQLKEQLQQYETHALNLNASVKMLRDQLLRTSKSEEQLKFQTKHLMELNQSLQADLVEKIASETSSFPTIAKLEECEQKKISMGEHELGRRDLILRCLLRLKTRNLQRFAFLQWSKSAQNETFRRTKALSLLSKVHDNRALKLKAQALRKFQHVVIRDSHAAAMEKLQARLDTSKQEANARRIALGAMRLDRLMDHWKHRQKATTFCTWWTKLEESSCNDVQRLTGELRESELKLQLVKHGFVATVLRDAERAWLRTILIQWRSQVKVSVATKELRSQVKMAALKVAERDKYSKSLDDYSRVLRSDLERFQFFSLDKRITLDVLSKKLLREEERYRLLEERHGALQEETHGLKTQLASLFEWDGLGLSVSILSWCKDVAMSNLRELFHLHATTDGSERSEDDVASSSRLALSSFVRMLECSTLLEDKVVERETLTDRLLLHLPPHAGERGLVFVDFVMGLNNFLTDLFASSSTKHDQFKSKRFWASLFSHFGASCNRVAYGISLDNGRSFKAAGENGPSLMLCSSCTPWTSHLSDDILQNQEKLLALLEHETAVVERAVKEKVSLRHTCQMTDCSSKPSTALPASVSTDSTVHNGNQQASAFSMGAYANWYLSPQVRDLLVAVHEPILKLLIKYGQRTSALDSQYGLSDPAVFLMLTDLKLYPSFLSRDVIQTLIDRCRDAVKVEGGLLAPQAVTLLLGSCALELYARSLAGSQADPSFFLSAREILLLFFKDRGLLAESKVPAFPKLCFVGIDVESVLWPLFEYYAKSGENSDVPDDTRVRMTSVSFKSFMMDIAGEAANDMRTLLCRVRQELTKNDNLCENGDKHDDQEWTMHFDEFYVAISYVQTEQCPEVRLATPGEAVRLWLQRMQCL